MVGFCPTHTGNAVKVWPSVPECRTDSAAGDYSGWRFVLVGDAACNHDAITFEEPSMYET